MIEKAAAVQFVGQEFATWLYWLSDTGMGKVNIKDIEPFELWFESPVQLVADYGEATAVTVRGGTPLEGAEAHQALREGKKIDRARLRFNYRNQTYVCGLNASSLALSGLRTPVPHNASPADFLFLRLEIFEEFKTFFDSLFERFLEIRLTEKTWKGERDKIAEWVKNFSNV